MDSSQKKLKILKMVLNTQDIDLLERVEDILKKRQNQDWWDTVGEEEKKSIEKGIAESERGELHNHEDVMNDIKSRYNRMK